MRTQAVLFLAIASFAVLLGSALAVSGTLGVGVALTANTQTTIDFATGEQLIITADQASTITVSIVATLSKTLPTGYVQLSALVGYSILISPSTATVQGSFKTKPNQITASVLTAAGVSIPGVLYYDATADAYTDVTVPWTATDTTVQFTVPFTGTYFVLGLQANVPRPAVYGRVLVCVNDNTVRNYTWNDSKFTMQVRAVGTGTSQLLVAKTTTTTATAPAGKVAFGAFYNLTLTGATSFAGTMYQKYTTADLSSAGISNALSLRFAVRSGSSYTLLSSGGGTDTQSTVFYQDTTSSNDYGTYGDPSAASASPAQVASTLIVALLACIIAAMV
jgi:hypothetical protein